MAKAGKIPYVDAMSAISLEKAWAGATTILWVGTGGNGFPIAHKCRVPVSCKGVVQEGLFIDLFHKFSDLPGVPDKVSMTLVSGGARVLALDENGPTTHVNAVGRGMPHFQKLADHPHLHTPVPESSSGYAEPIDRVHIEALWRIFLERANIEGAPPFNLPNRGPQENSGQMDLL
ncbi:hypothetical protein [Pseudomonas japonica]|jgi:hypothetical protein|uniref:hypothetical protein n=1 Tax=Pseudomonas japonica TaxID=256466 RepID=UPI00113149BB|nr:hypothetical protein [Pseudomonas japonica]